MTMKAIPMGYCKDCRWARELPEGLKGGPFVWDCQAQPWQWEPREVKSGMMDAGGKQMTQITMVYHYQPHKGDDFCQFWAPRPIGGDLSDGGMGLGGPVGVPGKG